MRQWWRGRPVRPVESSAAPLPGPHRGQVDHVIMLDGTFSSLDPGHETNVGLIFQLLAESGRHAHLQLYYEPGSQWEGWRHGWDIIQGRGLDSQIIRAYGWLASHYRPGDRIYLIGYSRGAYAVRSLAGVIDRVGLLRQEDATERNVALIWRHYRTNPDSSSSRIFALAHCHDEAPIQMVGVFDTVKSMGLHLPGFWLFVKDSTGFHNAHLGSSIRHGFHALALHETRHAFAPVLWDCPPGWEGNVQQMWFHGAHGDVGGQVGGDPQARLLSNIPLVWMLERAATTGLPLPEGWQTRFPTDVNAPMVGTWRSWGKYFVLRSRRKVGRDASEIFSPTLGDVVARKGLFPWALRLGTYGQARAAVPPSNDPPAS